MTHHDTPLDRDTIEILRDGKWSVFTTTSPDEAQWFWTVASLYVFDRCGPELQPVSWAVWKRPSEARGYVARATYGREPDCPNCCAAGCPIAGPGYLPGESIEAHTARLNAGFPMVPAGQVEAEVAADVSRLFDRRQ